MAIAKQLTQTEIDRQDFVDNAIHELLMKLQVKGVDAKEFSDHCELVGDIRDCINDNWRDLYSDKDYNEQDFYPFIED